jgi:hypothetical protein
MTAKTISLWTVSTLALAAFAGGARHAFPQPPGDRCRQHELDVRIDATGNVGRPGDADGQETCYFVINVRNDSAASQDVWMNLERTTPSGQALAFDICQGRQLREARRAAPGFTQIACYVRRGVVDNVGNTTHPRDDCDAQTLRCVRRGFKYTLHVGSTTIDPDLRIER